MSRLQSIRNTSILLLGGSERVVADLPDGDVSGAKLRDALGGVGSVTWDGFPDEVRRAYAAIALGSRRIILTAGGSAT